jgi:Reverse transcriptase (RNA-dependent DNA polymerase)
MTFLDMEKAFDAVWRNGLIHKMYLGRFSMRMITIIRSFLSGRTFHVRGTHSVNRSISWGVPQAAVLSLILYSYYIFDFPILNEVKLVLFADDTAVYCTSDDPNIILHELQNTLNIISNFSA